MPAHSELQRQPVAADLLPAVDEATHDITNLLGVVLNYTALVARQVHDPTALSDLSQIQAAAQQAVDRTQQLLASVRGPEPRTGGEATDG